MSVTYPILCGVVVIDSTNNAIRFKEGGTTETVTVTSGSYHLRGDGSADDLCFHLVNAFASNTNATNPNSYTVGLAYSIDAGAPTAVVTITRATGTSTFRVLWADALTTFDPLLIGFPATNTADDGNPKASTLSPTCAWVSNEPFESRDTRSAARRVRTRFVGKQTQTSARGLSWDLLDCSLAFVDPRRTLEASNAADEAATFQAFWRVHSDGRRIEIYDVTIASGTTLTDPATASRVGTSWEFDQTTEEAFDPQRLDPGLELYRWPLGFEEYAAA